MRASWEYLVAGPALILSLMLGWFVGVWLKLQVANFWFFFSGVAALAVTSIGGFLWWARSRQANKPLGAGEASPAESARPGVATDEIDLVIREAKSRVAAARLGGGAKLASLPTIFVLGETGSGKTDALLHCGLEPELLAGQVYQEGAVIPTRLANFWFARKTLFVEAGGKLITEPKLWVSLVQRLAPGRFRSAVGRKQQAPRAAVVCFDCEKFIKSPSPETVATTAGNLRGRLEEMSQSLGISFPVYVLFSKADRVPFFDEFVSNFTNEEATQVLGVTLPIQSGYGTGVYAEQETKRLTAAFNSLFYSLSDCRPGLLSRERNAEKQPGVYEFPRQFRKLGTSAVQFLVDLCRPSHLRAGPFLRGFYFTGLRRMTTSVASPTVMATRTALQQAAGVPANATRILRLEELPAPGRWDAGTQIQGAEPQRVSQWVFLSHIFSHVLLQDRAALGASSASTKVNLWRRALLASAAALGLILIIGFIVSYASNRSLETEVRRAAQGIHFSELSGTQLPSVDELQRLEILRQSLEKLRQYEQKGAPWKLRWGLYVGDNILPDARKIYFDRFRQLLLAHTQEAMRASFLVLPRAPGSGNQFDPTYETLAAYLITTSNPEKNTREFLSAVLLTTWVAGREVDADRKGLAEKQFDFYSDELRFENPSKNDVAAVDRARGYLKSFAAAEQIYARMRSAAATKSPRVNFYHKYPEAVGVIQNVPEVPAAFTKNAWAFMQDAITHSDRYFKGEEWVLGPASSTTFDRASLQQQLHATYQKDYIQKWREFLSTARIAGYASPDDAIRKLKKLAGNASPLLALLCETSQNTAVDSSDVQKAFKPVQQVVPTPCENKFVQQSTNQNYVAGLAKLQDCLERVAAAPPDQRDALKQQCNTVASDAKLVAGQIGQGLDVDQEAHIDRTVQRLLEEPIRVPHPPAPPGSGAKGLCNAFARITSRYPFNPNNQSQDVTLQEFDEFFQPVDGALAKFIHANQGVLVPQGSEYNLKPGAKVDWAPAFLLFLNKAHFIKQALYPAGAKHPQYRFTVRAILPEGGINGVTFILDGQTLRYPGGPQSLAFVWPGSGLPEARISYRIGGGQQESDLLSAQGPWAILKILSNPDAKVTSSGSTLRAEWHPLQPGGRAPLTVSGTGRPIVVPLEFESGGMPFVFQSSYVSNLSCRVAR